MKTFYRITIVLALICGGICIASLITDWNVMNDGIKTILIFMLVVCTLGIVAAVMSIKMLIEERALKSKNKHLYEQPGVALQTRANAWWYNTNLFHDPYRDKYYPGRTLLSLTSDEILYMYKQEHFDNIY